MSEYINLQSKCQRGESSISGANNLLAECHAALGKLLAEKERLERAMKLRNDNLTILVGDVESKDQRIRNHFETIDALSEERDQLKAENEALRKISQPTKIDCLVCGLYHGGLPCPNTRTYAFMGNGDQS